MTARPCLTTSLLALLASPLAALAAPTYTINFLPAGFVPSAISSSGHLVGTANGAAAILSGSTLTGLGASVPASFGLAINGNNDVAGTWRASFGPFSGGAFAYSGGAVQDIGGMQPVEYTSQANAINNSGQVAFTRQPPVGEAWRGFVYDHGTMTAIGTFGGEWSQPYAINNSGQVVGAAALPSPGALVTPFSHAFVFQSGVLQDIGTLGGHHSTAFDINDAGQIVGASEAIYSADEAVPSRPFIYQAGLMTDLGTLGGAQGSATGINHEGLIVGSSDVSLDASMGTDGFLYAHGQMTDLNALIDPTSGWRIVSARDISDDGQILARACQLGACVDVRLDPLVPMPEPASAGMLAAGVGVLALMTRRRRAQR